MKDMRVSFVLPQVEGKKHFFHLTPVEFLCLSERKVIVQSHVCNDQMKNQVKILGAMFSVIIAGETDEHMKNNKSKSEYNIHDSKSMIFWLIKWVKGKAVVVAQKIKGN